MLILIILINLHLELPVEHHDRDLSRHNLHQERLVEQRDRDLSPHPSLHLELPQSGRRPRPY